MIVLSMYNDHVTRNVIQHNNALNYNLNKSIFPLMAIILHTFYLTAIFMLRVYISVTLNSFLYILPTAIKILHALSIQLLHNCNYSPTWNISLRQFNHSNAVAASLGINNVWCFSQIVRISEL